MSNSSPRSLAIWITSSGGRPLSDTGVNSGLLGVVPLLERLAVREVISSSLNGQVVLFIVGDGSLIVVGEDAAFTFAGGILTAGDDLQRAGDDTSVEDRFSVSGVSGLCVEMRSRKSRLSSSKCGSQERKISGRAKIEHNIQETFKWKILLH